MKLVKYSVIFLTIAVIGGFVAAFFLFNKATRIAFPDLRPGLYVGRIDILLPSRRIQDPLLLIRAPESRELSILVMGEKLEQDRYALVPNDFVRGEGGGWLPLDVATGGDRLRFSGSKTGENTFEGEVKLVSSGTVGRWKVQSVKPSPAGSLDSFQEWLANYSGNLNLDDQIIATTKKIEEQKSRIERLNSLVFEGADFKQHASDRIENTDAALEDARKVLKEKQAELSSLQGSLSSQMELSPQGNLASLARQVLDREYQWEHAVLDESARETTPAFKEELQHAEKIKALKDAIAAEQKAINDLQHNTAESELPSEVELYGGLER